MSRPLIIDSFAGGGGASEGIRAAIGRDPDFALNHDRIALAMHRINHPDTHHIEEDVWNVDARAMCAGRPVGLLWMSPDCFPAGTLVLTQAGYRPIETIAVGDLVLTHAGRWRPVTETSRARRPLMTLRGHGHPGLAVSPEHPFYARKRTLVWDNEKRQDVPTYSAPEWVPASALNTGAYRYQYDNGRKAGLDGGWYWGTPMSFPAMDIPSIGGRPHPIDPDLMWLAGRYVGDGWTRLTDTRAELVITCGKHEVERLRPLLDRWQRTGAHAGAGEMTWHERATGTAYQFATNHRGLVMWLRENFGHRAEAKGMPAWGLGMPEDLRRGLLEGYLSADGSRKANRVECTTVSKALAFGIKALATSLGFVPTVYLGKNTTEIAGRTVNSRPTWHVRWRDPLGRRQVVEEGGIQWSPIRARTEPAGEADVFNIGVEDDESYVVEGVIVHNCKHFSKAKGGKPREKAIRGLAWVGVRWIKSLPKWQRPRLVCLENVEEFQDWGPLLNDGRPCPVQRGVTFKSFVAAFEAMGYVVDWRELRACDYGAPTIRKRLFLIARRDGRPIEWPAPTHGDPKSEAVRSGALLPWRTAAEIIDWSLPCPSIFETSAEIKARWGIRANRPLADATMARIAKGTMRYVVNAARPFLVRVNHGDSRGRRDRGLDEPAPTATHYSGDALVRPFVAQVNHGGGAGGRDHALTEPMPTLTGGRGEALVTPFVTYGQQGGGNRDAADPLHTLCASPKDQNAIVAPFLAPRYQEKPGHEPRVRSVEEPTATIIGGDNVPGHLIGACLVPRYGERPGQDPRARAIDEPAPVIVPTGNEGSLAAVHLTRQFGASVGSAAEEPVGTITAGGAGKAGVVAAFLAQHNTEANGEPKAGSDARKPVSTITSGGGHQTVVAAHMLNLRGSDRRDGPINAPTPTVTGGGNHAAAVYAFLQKYYGTGGQEGHSIGDPLATVTAKDRCGVVTVTVNGQPYAIVDIGMRMLTPRERFNAQGFRPDYVIDRGELEDGSKIALTLEQQGRACGNSVCPQVAQAIVAANYREDEMRPRRSAAAAEPMPLFAAE